ncbi:unnamed protein product [Cutaneotrichosporon oleaginosum]
MAAPASASDGPDALSMRIHPSRRRSACAPIPLISISSVSAPPAQVLLFYDTAGAAPLTPDALAHSLALVLNAYPQFAGQLRHPPSLQHSLSSTSPSPSSLDSTPFPDYTHRFLRPWIEYGHNDPGLLLTFERRPGARPALPETWERIYDLDGIDPSLAPTLAPNLSPTTLRTEVPISGVKVTLYYDGAAFVFGTSHVLADAGALGTFLQDWARIALHPEEEEDIVDELVEKRRVDWAALDAFAGDIDASCEEEAGLDLLRYDAWAPGAPPGMRATPDPAIEHLDRASGCARGPAPPWDTLHTAPAKRYAINFTEAEVERIWANAKTHAPRASANDALVAHLWRSITCARGSAAPPGPLELSMACDVRRHLAGVETPACFNICLGLLAAPEDVARPGWAEQRIRRAVDGVTAPRVAAWLRRRAQDLDPRRKMVCFPGYRSVCVTNWARARVLPDFGGGAPRFAHNFVQAFGGYFTIMKAARGGRGGEEEGRAEEGREGKVEKWYEPGVDVLLWLEEGGMERLVRDPLLRG